MNLIVLIGEKMRRKKLDWFTIALLVVGILMVVCSVGMWIHLVSSQVATNNELNAIVKASDAKAGSWPSAKQESVLDAAYEYNKKLDVRASDFDNSRAAINADTDYLNTLDTGNGVMASVYIPSISTRVPVYHGTDDETLLNGAGHMRGTDLPTGEKGTVSVIAGHSGAVEGMFFTRVPSLKTGDLFYVTVLGKELPYRITDLITVNPDDTDAIRKLYESDKAKVVLLTCTPISVNTHRLLVVGEPAPDSPKSADAPGDVIWPRGVILAALGVVVFIVLIVIIRVFWRKRKMCAC